MDILISNLLSEPILDFRKWSNGKYKTRVYMYFQFDHFPKLKIDSESRFEKRMPVFLF